MTNKDKKQAMVWLRTKMDELEYTSLQQVADAVGINRGNLYRYFTLETRPSIDMIPLLCHALSTDVNTLLRALKVIKDTESL